MTPLGRVLIVAALSFAIAVVDAITPQGIAGWPVLAHWAGGFAAGLTVARALHADRDHAGGPR